MEKQMIDTFLSGKIKLNFLKKVSLEPSQITALGLLSGVLFIPAISYGHTVLALFFLLLSGFFDMLDGAVARLNNKTSNTGAVYDIVCDRAVEFSIVLGLFLVSPETRGLISILMLGAILLCVTTFLVVGIFEQNRSQKGFHYSPGLMERAEAFAFFFLMTLFPSFYTILGVLFVILVSLTALIRIWQFR